MSKFYYVLHILGFGCHRTYVKDPDSQAITLRQSAFKYIIPDRHVLNQSSVTYL